MADHGDLGCQEQITEFKPLCDNLRSFIKEAGRGVRSLMDHEVFQGEQAAAGQHSEMKANIMLAYKHLEDARMRVGRVLQAFDGGVSCYDR